MRRRPALRALPLAVAIALTAALAGCTAPAADDSPAASTPAADAAGNEGQSTSDACAIVQESIDGATATFASADPSDPASVVTALESASAELGTISAQVTNDDVAALLPPLRDMFAQAAEAMAAMAEGDVSRAGDISALSARFQESAAAYQELCETG
ncbi:MULTISPECIES: hypothetical protein [Microbacterium]|uniref:Uncharacterized protein n=1 Tax=Microbacterium wangchenii TaxID=2541726 RepID=A0ABX5SSX7_9MICO|nr:MULTISPECIES: hypothetical protein [Microbacterium]MCK6066631.1 hypothetical protein [Microbacterium sp. EYE_512]QBR87965.1 hypothetical protein E4K62_04190 [Microbacterium wangchenii]TXK18245.1 hypothetical protein FVP99_06610 [Microbacterium wangchenii]